MRGEERIALARAANPASVDLARWVSLTSRVPAALMRRARLRWLPAAGPSVESDLWFGPLTEHRERGSITLFPDVASRLRAELGADEHRLEHAHKLLNLVRASHRPPLLAIEDELIWGGIMPSGRDAAKERLRAVIKAIVEQNRRGLGRWALGLRERIPEISEWKETGLLYAVAFRIVHGALPQRERIGVELDDAEWALLRQNIDRVRVGLHYARGYLQSREPAREGDVIIDVPAGDLRIIDIGDDDVSRTRSTPTRLQWRSSAGRAWRQLALPAMLSTLDGVSIRLSNRVADAERLVPLVSPYLVTLHAGDGSLSGSGWLAQDDLVVTANNVASRVTSRDDELTVRFPYLPGSRVDAQFVRPPTAREHGDAVLVRLASLPPRAVAARRAAPRGRSRVVAVLSSPADREDRSQWLRFELEPEASARSGLRPLAVMSNAEIAGCAGSPVIDPKTGQVLGACIVEYDRAFCLLDDGLRAAFPEFRPMIQLIDRQPAEMTDTAETQDGVFAFLGRSSTHGGADVHRIDTHAAVVFLVGERAYKVKRAVRFPFLDFSTLEKRRAACTAEIEANRPFAPGLYRRVIAITREPDGALSLGGVGEPVEWAVEMHRFDEGKTLDRLADNGTVDLALADSMARAVAAAHAQAPVVDAVPWIDALAAYVEQNDAAFRENPELFSTAATERLTAASREALSRIRPLLVTRGTRGLVRRGHGDLHLGNIALIDGRPVPFDALEFDPVVASGDVLYDLAFLLMDLVERRLQPAANVVLNRYLAETRRPDDLDALAALPFLMSMRAAIRAKVTAARAAFAPKADRASTGKAATTYFELAAALIAPPPPTLVAIGGLSGTGKSVLARALAPELVPAPGAVVLRSDAERKALFGVAETDRLPADAYTAEITVRTYAALAEKARRVTAAGHSAVVDAVFAAPAERAAVAAVASGTHVAFRSLFLTADLATRIARVGHRAGDASDADAMIAEQQESYALGPMDWSVIDASGTPAHTLSRAKDVVF